MGYFCNIYRIGIGDSVASAKGDALDKIDEALKNSVYGAKIIKPGSITVRNGAVEYNYTWVQFVDIEG